MIHHAEKLFHGLHQDCGQVQLPLQVAVPKQGGPTFLVTFGGSLDSFQRSPSTAGLSWIVSSFSSSAMRKVVDRGVSQIPW